MPKREQRPVGRLHADDTYERSRLTDRAAGVGARRAETQIQRQPPNARAARRTARNKFCLPIPCAATATTTGPNAEGLVLMSPSQTHRRI